MDALSTIFEDALLEEYEEAMEVTGPVAETGLTQEEPASVPSSTQVTPSEPLSMTDGPVAVSPKATDPVKGPSGSVEKSDSNEGLQDDNRAKARSSPCSLCKKPHPLRACFGFRQLAHEKKLRHVLIWGHCARCLASNHTVKNCRSQSKCGKCQGDHNTLLHSPKRGPKTPSVKKGKKSHTPALSHSSPVMVTPLPLRHVVTFSPTLQVKLRVGDREIRVRAVLDLCCSISYVDDQLISKLRIPVSNSYCRITIQSIYDPLKCISLTSKVTKMHGIQTPRESVAEAVKEHFPGLQLADPTFYHAGKVALVLGPEISPQIMTGKVYSSPGSPLAQYTIFGWVISGQSPF